MFNKLQFALNSRIIQHTNLFATEKLPSFPIKLLEELDDMFGLNKIDEAIANIAFILNT